MVCDCNSLSSWILRSVVISISQRARQQSIAATSFFAPTATPVSWSSLTTMNSAYFALRFGRDVAKSLSLNRVVASIPHKSTFLFRSYSSSTMPISESTYKTIFDAIDARQEEFVKCLKEAVAIRSVSTEPERRPDCVKMVEWMKKKLEDVGAKTQLVENGKQKLHDGRTIDLPPILFAVLGDDPKKKTLLVYGHLDVQPAYKEDGWNTDPWVLTEIDKKFYGRGSTDDKAPVISWVHVISVMQQKKIPLPVNLKFVFECMEEDGSQGLEEALKKHKDTFLKGVDMTCIADNYWLGKDKPCITYGLRGLCYYFIEISCAKQDLHSGSYGGSVPEAMTDLVWILSQLIDKDGKIKIPGIYDTVAPLTSDEKALYSKIDFDPEEYRKEIAAHGLLKKTKEEVLMSRWRDPSLSIHGIEGAFGSPGAKTIIPCKVIGKFSIRIVPNMVPAAVDKLVINYLNDIWAKHGSPNHFKASAHHNGMHWLGNYKDHNFQAGVRAIKRVYGVEPDYTREGGSIPITLAFQELTGKSVMLLPVGAGDDMPHSQNEKMNRSNFIEGTKMMAAYLLEIAE
ncbi:unnamed protein product [Cylicocyclus nassatus]|uniref:Peptidase M20 dimerisation domain-containing protein n=1 Tax=Cylicocyclus nassatus TaxID=53992 RepID=A0AA36HGP9_CYLNA|nr:unnamed protein product [Cylicocyclus nassatus]